MVKKSVTKNTNKTKVANIWHKHWQKILVAVIVVGVVGFVAVNQLIIYNQKQQFNAAEESLDALYADIVKQTGQPTSVTKDKSCGYASTKMGKGRLGCGISYDYSYTVINTSEANKLRESVVDVIKKTKTVTYLRDAPFIDGKNSVAGENTAGDIKSADGSSYAFTVDYKNSNGDSGTKNQISEVKFWIGYGGYPKTELYPVKN